MDYDKKTLRRYKLKFENFKKPQNKKERDRNDIIGKYADNSKLCELNYLKSEMYVIREVSKNQHKITFQQHLRKPYCEVIEFLQKRVDELEEETKHLLRRVYMVQDERDKPDMPDHPGMPPVKDVDFN